MDRFPLTSTALMRRVTTSLSRSRRIVSTSGSSGTARDPLLDHGFAVPADLVPIEGAVPIRVHVPAPVPVKVGALDQHHPGHAGGGLLGVLLRTSLPHPALGSGHRHRGSVPTGMIRSRALDLVSGQLTD